MSALEKEDSVLEFMSENGLAVRLTVSANIVFYLKDQRLRESRFLCPVSKILAILTKNDNSSRSDGRWNTSKSSRSDSGGSKGIVGTPFSQMPNLFRIRRNDFERIKVTQYFLLLFCMCNVFMTPFGHVCSVGSFRYGSIVCSTSTNSISYGRIFYMLVFLRGW